MVFVEKDGRKMGVRDDNQLSAFLNNGWKKAAEKKPVKDQNEEKPAVKKAGRPKKTASEE